MICRIRYSRMGIPAILLMAAVWSVVFPVVVAGASAKGADANAATLVVGDVKDAASLSSKLQARADAVSRYVWDRFSDETKLVLSEVEEGKPVPPGLVQALVADLNQVIGGESIYDEQRFSGIELRESTTELLGQADEAAGLLNRRLLEGAYPNELVRWLEPFPPPLASYGDTEMESVVEILKNRIAKQPLNLWLTVMFVCAVIHTFFTQKFRHLAHVLEERHREEIRKTGRTAEAKDYIGAKDDVSIPARIFHFLGEVEAVFGIWVIPVFALMVIDLGLDRTVIYLNDRVSYDEPIFVVIVMAIASTRPILRLAEYCLRFFARFGGSTPQAWWFSILTVGPLLGSFITEPAAMTICASLLGKQFYVKRPSARFAYATLGLLFVNVSVGGTLTHFAAPPVLMVAKAWNWDTVFMATHFGWIAAIGIVVSNALYFSIFRKHFTGLQAPEVSEAGKVHWFDRDDPIPWWVTAGHVLFLGAAVYNAHHPTLLMFSFLFFIAFFEVTEDYQGSFSLRSPILVGFFLGGLVIHGGLQQWWIEPVLGSMGELELMFGAIGLTAFNDNAAITYLSTLVPSFTESMKYAVVAGAVTGGGLTVIANAPNPAGQSILGKYFHEGISPMGLLLGALAPTAVMALCFILLNLGG